MHRDKINVKYVLALNEKYRTDNLYLMFVLQTHY